MNRNLIIAPNAVTTITAAGLSVVAAVALLTSVAVLFERDGRPFEQAVAAEHACADRAFISERNACVQAFIAAAQARNVAAR